MDDVFARVGYLGFEFSEVFEAVFEVKGVLFVRRDEFDGSVCRTFFGDEAFEADCVHLTGFFGQFLGVGHDEVLDDEEHIFKSICLFSYSCHEKLLLK